VAPLPIVHSILDANALGKRIAERYALPAPVHCELLTRGMNDVYLVRDGSGEEHACRVWRAGFRSESDVAYETELLNYLDGKGFMVPAAVAARDGRLYVPVKGPEGQRYFALFRWVEGRAFGDKPDAATARELGRFFGRFHKATGDFRPTRPRQVDMAGALRRSVEPLRRMTAHRPGDPEYYAKACPALADALDRVDAASAPTGPTHGDFHLYNAFVRPDRSFVIMDFDNCGVDRLAQELNSFLWANDYVGVDKSIGEAFLAGYEAERPMSAREKALMPLFYAAKELRFLGGFASNVNAVGHTPLLNPDLDWFGERVRAHVKAAGVM
jgi:Ser/Thr protein kinase RdoA (MazF antagonist)